METYPEILPFLRVASHFLSANFLPFKTVLLIMRWIRIAFGRLDPDTDPGRKKLPTSGKSEESSCFECSEGFSCSLKVLHVGLRITKIEFSVLKNSNFFSSKKKFYDFWSSKP
jgi:hypothetical protein